MNLMLNLWFLMRNLKKLNKNDSVYDSAVKMYKDITVLKFIVYTNILNQAIKVVCYLFDFI